MRYAVMLLWCPLLQRRTQPCTVEVDSAALLIAERRKLAAYPEFARGGPQRLLVLGTEIGGRWSAGAQSLSKSMTPFRGVVEKIKCNLLVPPRFGIYIGNLSLLASSEKDLTATMRSLLTSDCGVAELAEACDSAMNIAPLHNTSRVFPKKVMNLGIDGY